MLLEAAVGTFNGGGGCRSWCGGRQQGDPCTLCGKQPTSNQEQHNNIVHIIIPGRSGAEVRR